MARCEDCIHGECCRIYIPVRTILCGDKADERCKWFKSTADVVPKSEVDKTIAEWAWLHADTLNKLDKAKADVAREIFAEIQEDCFDQFGYFDYDAFAELKEKYIPQDCRDCKHMLSCEPNVFGICDEYEEKET